MEGPQMMLPSTISSATEVESLVERDMYGSFFQFPQMIKIHRQP